MNRQLTPRQLEAAQFICQGFSNPEIAAAMKVSLHTIKNYTNQIMWKVGVNNRQDVINRCCELGIVDGNRKPLPESLTPREHNVAAGVLRAMHNKDIGATVGISEQMVKNYLRNVFDKCGVWTRAELVARYTI